MDWFPITLICAISLAGADAGTKAWLQAYSAPELALVRFSVTGLLVAPLLWFFPLGIPEPAFWYWMAALVPLEIAAMLLYMAAIRDHPLAQTLPYLAFTPVLVVVTGWVLLEERLDARGLAGVLVVVAGSWLLNLEQARADDWRTWLRPLGAILYQPGARMMMGVAVIYSLTSSMGKVAMQYSTPQSFGPFYFVLVGSVAAILFSVRQPAILGGLWRRPWPVLLVAGLTGVMLVSHFIALSMVEVAYMISVKRTSLLFGVLFGALFFAERGLRIHLFAAALMVAGVAVILL